MPGMVYCLRDAGLPSRSRDAGRGGHRATPGTENGARPVTTRILVTGADGFIGRNLRLRLSETGRHEVLPVTRQSSPSDLRAAAGRADAVIHLAGVNRARSAADFQSGNAGFTAAVCDALAGAGRRVPVIAASSIQVGRETPYARSKQEAERHLEAHAAVTAAPVAICRLPNVFGKWARSDYNSVVATFCHNIARDLPIRIDDPRTRLRLVHVDDVIDGWLSWLETPSPDLDRPVVRPEYSITLGDLAATLRGFRALRETRPVPSVGTGLMRALYATYMSYLPMDAFSYPLTRHEDARGVFVEMLQTEDSGQVSYFTARPGATRGGHYHHAKTEKFLVLKGHARFRFRNLDTGTRHSLETRGDSPRIVETPPGWSHDITNIGEDDLIVMLWANELFDRSRPDTIASEV